MADLDEKERLGFRAIDEAQIARELERIRQHEAVRGLARLTRVTMPR